MESHNILPSDPTAQEILIAAVTEHPFYEILPERRIVEPPFFLDGNQGEPLDKGPRKKPDALPGRHATVIVDADPFDAAAGRIFLEDVAGQIHLLEFLNSIRSHGLYCFSVILPAL